MENFLLLYRNGLENAEKIILKLVCTSCKIWIYVDPQGSGTRELVFNVYNSILRIKKKLLSWISNISRKGFLRELGSFCLGRSILIDFERIFFISGTRYLHKIFNQVQYFKNS